MEEHLVVPRLPHIATYRLFRSMLTDLRHQKRVTQKELARRMGVPQSYISKYELGERRIDLVETLEICRALDSDPVTFLRKLIKTIESEGTRTVSRPREDPRGWR